MELDGETVTFAPITGDEAYAIKHGWREEDNMTIMANELVKGQRIRTRTTNDAIVRGKPKGILVLVEGHYPSGTEVSDIYIWDVSQALAEGVWQNVMLTERQAKRYTQVRKEAEKWGMDL